MSHIALEFVPPNVSDGPDKAAEEAAKVKELFQTTGITDRVDTLMIPGLIDEDPDRPVALEKKMDPMDVFKAAKGSLPLDCIVTQVTPFLSPADLEKRVQTLQGEGINRIVFVGVPRTMADGEGDGMAPTDALSHFSETVPHRGCILIPTREGEQGRFQYKLDQGANFALTQLLYSDHITKFLPEMQESGHKPRIYLSFGYVPKSEPQKGLIRWLIQDDNPLVQQEMEWVAHIAEKDFDAKKHDLVELYKRVIDGVHGLGFPLGVHLECPYGFSKPAFETFHDMLYVWTPED